MTPDTVVQLGDFSFKSFEVPERLPFGGAQQAVVHKLIGGKRIVDAMGRDDAPIEWSGLLTGADADDRSHMLDSLRINGDALDLSWGTHAYKVLVRETAFDYQRFYQIGYRIVCEVIEDRKNTVAVDTSTNIDDTVAMDAEEAAEIADEIDNSALTELIGDLVSAVDAIESLVTAATSALTDILEVCALAQSAISALIDTDEATIATYSTLGGVTTGSTYGEANTSLTALQTAIDRLTELVALQARVNRISANVEADNAKGKTVRVAGGTLYKIAADTYGDVSGWTTIARANDLTDPQICGIAELHIPTAMDDNDGVLVP